MFSPEFFCSLTSKSWFLNSNVYFWYISFGFSQQWHVSLYICLHSFQMSCIMSHAKFNVRSISGQASVRMTWRIQQDRVMTSVLFTSTTHLLLGKMQTTIVSNNMAVRLREWRHKRTRIWLEASLQVMTSQCGWERESSSRIGSGLWVTNLMKVRITTPN